MSALRARIDSWEDALETVKASGARRTELDDVKARMKKLGEDLDELKSASADDWWNVSRKRVADYIDRVEASVARLDDRGTAGRGPDARGPDARGPRGTDMRDRTAAPDADRR